MQTFSDWVFCFAICLPTGFSVGMGISYLIGRFPELFPLNPEGAFAAGFWSGVFSWFCAACCCLGHWSLWLAAPIALFTPWFAISVLLIYFQGIPRLLPLLISINQRCLALGAEHKAVREDEVE